MKTHAELRAAQAAAGLTDAQCAELVGVTSLTWKRWVGKTSRPTEIDSRGWELFLLKTGEHPEFELRKRHRLLTQSSPDRRVRCNAGLCNCCHNEPAAVGCKEFGG